MNRIVQCCAGLLVAPLVAASTADGGKNVADAGGYRLNISEFSSWSISTDKEAGLIVLRQVDESQGIARHISQFRVLKMVLPPDQRNEEPVAIAAMLTKGENSYVRRNFFVSDAANDLKREKDFKVGERKVIAYAGQVRNLPRTRSVTARTLEYAKVYFWFPDDFRATGAFFIVTGFEVLVSPPEVAATLTKLPSLVAAILSP